MSLVFALFSKTQYSSKTVGSHRSMGKYLIVLCFKFTKKKKGTQLSCTGHVSDSLLWVAGGICHGDNSAECTMGPPSK